MAEAALEKKARNPVLLHVTELVSYADYLLVLTATSAPQAKAIAEGVMTAAKKAGFKVHSKEGLDAARWILVDVGDVVMHVFQPEDRDYYDLEALWLEAPRIEIPGADEATELAPLFAS
ncbi:MAG: ribosome silencing factor [Proteobacteria bacterium]|nr:ribosome silencing factor [Pseudomonadota bacterium]